MKNKAPRLLVPLMALALAACQERDPSEEAAARPVDAKRIDDAAAQSDPASAAILENAADAAGNGSGVAAAQNALATAGNATQAEGVAMNRADPAGTPLPQQAIPNRDGQRRNVDEKGQLQARPKFVPTNARD